MCPPPSRTHIVSSLSINMPSPKLWIRFILTCWSHCQTYVPHKSVEIELPYARYQGSQLGNNVNQFLGMRCKYTENHQEAHATNNVPRCRSTAWGAEMEATQRTTCRIQASEGDRGKPPPLLLVYFKLGFSLVASFALFAWLQVPGKPHGARPRIVCSSMSGPQPRRPTRQSYLYGFSSRVAVSPTSSLCLSRFLPSTVAIRATQQTVTNCSGLA